MIVLTKSQASKIADISKKRRFCTGKYNNMIGRQVVDLPNIICVWQEKRHDEFGIYYALFCV